MKLINKALNKLFDIDFFKTVFLISCFFYCIPFTNFIFVSLFKLFIAWGAVTFLYNFFANKSFNFKKADYLLFVFLVLAAASCIFNFRQNLVTNLISVAYLFIQTILMLAYNRGDSLEEKIKKIRRFSKISVVLTFPCAVISLLIFLLNFKLSFRIDFQQYVFGIFEGRLWGVQGNPNSLAQFALVSIWMSVILLIINKNQQGKKGERVFLYTNICLEAICYVLTNSRSTMVGLYASVFVFTLIAVGLKVRKSGDTVLKALLKNKLTTLIKVSAILLSMVLITVIVKQGMLLASKPFEKFDLNFLGYFDTNPDESEEDESKVDREYLTGDYSNGRLEIWGSAFKVIAKNPVFGVGTKNVNAAINQHIKEFNQSITATMTANTHNIYVQVLVSHGAVAFIFFALFLLFTILRNIKFLFTFDSDDENNKFIFSLILGHFALVCSLLVINLFDSNILYFCSIFMVPVFWVAISNINSLFDSLKNKKRKVLFSISNLGGGGAEKVLLDLTDNINYQENDVVVQTIFNEGKYINELNENIKYTSILKKPTLLKKRILSRVIKYFPKKFVYNWFVDGNYDVEIAFLESLPVKLLCGSTSNRTKIAWVHADIFAIKETLKLFINRKKLIESYQSFDRVVCVSESVRSSFVAKTNLHQNTVTVYNPVDKKKILKKAEAECTAVANPDKLTLISVGRLNPEKGVLRLCEVINKIVVTNKNIEFWILGDGPESGKIEDYIKANGLEEYIKLFGFVDNPYPYIKKADLFVCASFTEGFSLVLAEAMVLSKPVLAANSEGPANLLSHGKYGYIVENSLDGLYGGIMDLIENPAKLEEIKEKVVLRQDFFKLEEIIGQLEDLLSLKEKINKKSHLFCTVFTPAYNRGYIIEKLYNSLKAQSCKDFEWVVVDDGSTDNTEELFDKWCKEENGFKIKYLKTQNGGKQRAVNKGIDLASGKMFFIVDSDDYLTENAIERLKAYEETIKDYNDFAGVAALKGYDKQKVIGSRNEKDFVDATNLNREDFNLTGDKAECYYLDLLKRYKFPEVPSEKFVTECVVWDKIAADGYKIRWFNEILYLAEYLEDGYTNAGNSLLQKNPIGFLIYLRNEKQHDPLNIKKHIGNYGRYYDMVKDSKDLKEIADDLVTSPAFLKLALFLFNIKRKLKGN